MSPASVVPSSDATDEPPQKVRDVRHLGDFTTTQRVLFITLLALPIGAVSALVSWALLRLIGLITNLVFYQRIETELVAPGAANHNPFVILLAPVFGGLVIGLMARYGSEKIRGHGMPEAIEAILMGGSKVEPRVAVLKPISSAIAIGTGGPFGAEGPIIMTGGAMGSLFAQFLHLTADERKTLLVAGATAGMAATFNTPFAALMLAVELLLFEWRPRSLIPVAGAVCVATVVRMPLLGSGPLFPVHAVLHLTPTSYGLCVVSGVISGLLAIFATGLVYASEDAFRRLPIHWMWWPAIGGLIIGIGGLFVPQALGVGYNVIGAELTGSISLGLVAGILIVKTLIWSLSLGSGTSGGVLAPMFMIGGALGALEAQVFPDVGTGFWALIALAGVLGGVMRSPFTGVVFALELTHQFDAILPLIIGATTAFAVSVLLLKRSVLTEKIARRGYHLTREYDVDPLEVLFAGEVMSDDVLELDMDLTVSDAVDALGSPMDGGAAWRQRLYPVVDSDGTLAGVVTRKALFTANTEGDGTTPLSALIREPRATTHPDQTLKHVAGLMAVAEVNRMPVVDRDDPHRVVGMVTLTQLLAARQRDQQEARERERVFRVRLARPTRSHDDDQQALTQ
ncbi:MAG TPA: chloride channel protein [Segeticoccus sp.]|uniref:chloride channel protein n=1 Tax=Segeticoccus sp. TaxID=2706531 RepID=UPI002D7F9135|nr:chloride channel protein [Segeticoccus sp.]HET8599918.1 chloride channel protein [Segeticoccus sp.]